MDVQYHKGGKSPEASEFCGREAQESECRRVDDKGAEYLRDIGAQSDARQGVFLVFEENTKRAKCRSEYC